MMMQLFSEVKCFLNFIKTILFINTVMQGTRFTILFYLLVPDFLLLFLHHVMFLLVSLMILISPMIEDVG